MALILLLVALLVARPAGGLPGRQRQDFFDSTRTGSSQIFSMNPNGSVQTNITANRSLTRRIPPSHQTA